MRTADRVKAVPVHDHSGEIHALRLANARQLALIDLALELTSERNPDTMLNRVCVAARALFGASYVTLGIVDLLDRTVQCVVTCGSESDWINAGDAVPGILGTVIAERRTLRGDRPEGLGFPVRHPPVQAFLAAPVASAARIYGWLCLVGNDGRAFSSDDEHLVLALAGQIGCVWENVHFNAVSQQHTEELEHEVVERTQAEVALRQERDRANGYLQTAQVILLKVDLACNITLVNRYACGVLGWTAAELLGRDWIETCVPARMRAAIRHRLRNILDGDLSTVENPVVTKSGEERLVEWHNSILRDDDGAMIGVFASGTDITERHQAVEALRAAEERTRFALDAAGVGTWDLDHTTGVLRWSERAESHYGFQPGTFPGTFEAFAERIHPDDRESLLATIASATAAGADFTTDHRAVWPDGTVRWISGAGRIHLSPDGKPVRAVGISRDVTARHALQEQYQQAQKMEAIGRLAGGVAHDFNNLLTGILGHCELLLADLPRSDPRQADILAIQRAGESAAGLTRQLLAFSRKQIIELTLLDVNIVVADIRGMLERLIGEDVRIVITLRAEAAAVRADRTQIEQIIMNLAINARDAMPAGGTLRIETAIVDLDGEYAKAHFGVTPGRYVGLTVSDTGTGMTADVLARLFEPFFTTKPVGKGTGLGLATVHGVVAGSGGSVVVDSELGRGTSVQVLLPMADPAEAVVEQPSGASRRRAGAETVLVVDDSQGIRQLTRRLLERQGYAVLTAALADDAIQLFEDNPSIDLLLTDVVMPGSSGPELTRRLIERWPSLKVIYMSGYTEEAIVDHGVLNPGIAFLHKPFTSDSLGRKVREVLDR